MAIKKGIISSEVQIELFLVLDLSDSERLKKGLERFNDFKLIWFVFECDCVRELNVCRLCRITSEFSWEHPQVLEANVQCVAKVDEENLEKSHKGERESQTSWVDVTVNSPLLLLATRPR